jgi:hypothetical protein
MMNRSLVICHLSLVICHWSFVICQSQLPNSCTGGFIKNVVYPQINSLTRPYPLYSDFQVNEPHFYISRILYETLRERAASRREGAFAKRSRRVGAFAERPVGKEERNTDIEVWSKYLKTAVNSKLIAHYSLLITHYSLLITPNS